MAYALGCYTLWGVLPVYWKWLSALPATTILAHRIVWSLLFSALLLSVTRRWRELRAVLSGRATLVPLLAPTLLSAISLIYWFGNQGAAKGLIQAFGFENIYGAPGVVLAELDLGAVEAARRRIPSLSHGRRFEVAGQETEGRLHLVEEPT